SFSARSGSKSSPCSNARWIASFRSSIVRWFISLNCMYGLLNPLSRKKSASALSRSSALIPKSSPVYFEYRIDFKALASRSCELLIKLASRPAPAALFPLWSFPLALVGDETAFLVPADAAMRVQSFENEFGRRSTHGIWLARSQAERAGLLHQALDSAELFHHRFRTSCFIQLQRTAELEPLHHLTEIHAFKVTAVNLGDRKPDQFARNVIAAF